MEPIFNTVEYVKTLIIEELAVIKESGEAANIVHEFLEHFGSYDTFSLVYADAVSEIRDALADDCSEDLLYFLRRCTFMASRKLTESHDMRNTLAFELCKGIKAGIASLSDFFTEDDLANSRIMDEATMPMPVLMVALVGEVLSSTQGELYGEEDAESTVSA